MFQRSRDSHLSGGGAAVFTAPFQSLAAYVVGPACVSNLQVADPEAELCPIGMTASSAFVQGVRKCHAQTDLLGESPVQNKEGFFSPAVK